MTISHPPEALPDLAQSNPAPGDHESAQPRVDWAISLGLVALYLAIYLPLRPAHLTPDGAGAIRWFSDGPHFDIDHALWGPWLYGVIQIGRWFGLPPEVSGAAQASLMMALAVGGLFIYYRRCGVSRPGAVTGAMLFGLNLTALINATSVEQNAGVTFFCLLALLSLRTELLRPTRLGTLRLFLASVLVSFFAIGYSFLVLAIYLTLAWHARARWGMALWRLLQGAGVVLLMMILFYFMDQYRVGVYENRRAFFELFWRDEQGLAKLKWLLTAPTHDFAAFAGLGIFPALLALPLPALRRLNYREFWVICTTIYLLFFSFWDPDMGAFYLPLHMIWGLLATLALDHYFKCARRPLIFLIVGLAGLWAALIMPLRLVEGDVAKDVVKVVSFWGLLAILAIIAITRGAKDAENTPNPHSRVRFYWALYGCLTLLLNLWIYLPRNIALTKPGNRLEACDEHSDLFIVAVATDRGRVPPMDRWGWSIQFHAKE